MCFKRTHSVGPAHHVWTSWLQHHRGSLGRASIHKHLHISFSIQIRKWIQIAPTAQFPWPYTASSEDAMLSQRKRVGLSFPIAKGSETHVQRVTQFPGTNNVNRHHSFLCLPLFRWTSISRSALAKGPAAGLWPVR